MINKRVTFFLIFFISFMLPEAHAALTTKKQAPGLLGIKKWFNTEEPFPEKTLTGKVVLVIFLNPSSTKSLEDLQVLSQWYDRYKASAPFEMLGIAVPEFNFEKDPAKIEPILHKFKTPFPLALDSEQILRNNYGARDIPSYFLIDANGFIRAAYSHPVNYAALEENIQNLLKETSDSIPSIDRTNLPDFKNLPSFYFGYKNLSGYGGNEKLQAERSLPFSYPEKTDVFKFYLSGHWISSEESLKTAPPLSSIKILFDSSNASLVAGTERRNLIPAEVRLDGFPIPKESKGRDIVIQEGKSYVFIKDYRLYKLLKIKHPSSSHTLELIFEEPGIELFKAGFE